MFCVFHSRVLCFFRSWYCKSIVSMLFVQHGTLQQVPDFNKLCLVMLILVSIFLTIAIITDKRIPGYSRIVQ